MVNERLRAAIFSNGFDPDKISSNLGVDRKTVDRWIGGTVPYRRHQHSLSALLKTDLGYLWPAETPEQSNQMSKAELISIWAKRFHAPSSIWLDLFEKASNNIDILVYAGFWLSEDPAIRKVLEKKAKLGVQVRFLFGALDGTAVASRGIEEGIGDSLSAKIRNAIHNYRNIADLENVEIRFHDTPLYSSIYQADESMLVSCHIYGLPAHMTPLLHIQKIPGGELFTQYSEGFDRVWESAQLFSESEFAA
ncbi:MAG: XRE family transcriptional regulator [Acidimicrobiales bacterium]|nr:XRE family transcriptional regulator [Acidimicrobiales bacterium]